MDLHSPYPIHKVHSGVGHAQCSRWAFSRYLLLVCESKVHWHMQMSMCNFQCFIQFSANSSAILSAHMQFSEYFHYHSHAYDIDASQFSAHRFCTQFSAHSFQHTVFSTQFSAHSSQFSARAFQLTEFSARSFQHIVFSTFNSVVLNGH